MDKDLRRLLTAYCRKIRTSADTTVVEWYRVLQSYPVGAVTKYQRGPRRRCARARTPCYEQTQL
jgi:hypothetical protein